MSLFIGENTSRTIQQLDRIPLPTTLPAWKNGVRPEGSTWRPVQHGQMARMSLEAVEGLGLQITDHQWSTCFKDDAGLMGVIQVRDPQGSLIPQRAFYDQGLDTAIVLRHSNDARWSLNFQAGSIVWVCSNGLFSGKFGKNKVRRKHTKSMDLREFITESVAHVCGNFSDLARLPASLSEMGLTLAEGDHLAVEAAQRGITSWRLAGQVIEEWRDPRHPEFKPRNAWSLYNALTERVKDVSAHRQTEIIQGFGDLLLSYGATLVAPQEPQQEQFTRQDPFLDMDEDEDGVWTLPDQLYPM